MDKRKLPIGIQTFRRIREENRYYVDKTGYAARLAEEGVHYFLSRPRRFGKSLFVDTLKELFEGSEELFRGLAVHDRWDWSVRCPVLRMDFSGRDFETPEDVHRNVMAQLDEIERRRGIATGYDTAPERLSRLIEALREQDEHGRRVVVLVDEYDKPILDALDSRASAIANRNYLRSLYGAIKHRDADIRFSFLTGVSKFSKTNLFSTLNIHADLTLHPRHSAICGYTDTDLERVFAPELTGFDRDRIRKWYNGYGWLGEETVYNPYDVLHLFYRGRFGNYWIDSGTPKFVPEMLAQRHVLSAELDALWASESLLSSFEVGNIATEALLFQTGYLTIVGEEERYGQAHYRLGYPNLEVRRSLNAMLLDVLTGNQRLRETQTSDLGEMLRKNDFAGMRTVFQRAFASIPYQLHARKDLSRYEAYYASVVYSHLHALGVDAVLEDSSSAGRADLAARHGGGTYLFGFKMVDDSPTGAALAQLREKGYADKYQGLGRSIHLIGMEFSRKTRNVVAFDVETIADDAGTGGGQSASEAGAWVRQAHRHRPPAV